MTLLPSKVTVPVSGGMNPVTRLKMVVFPAPFGTDEAEDLPPLDLEIHVLYRRKPSEAFTEPLYLKKRGLFVDGGFFQRETGFRLLGGRLVFQWTPARKPHEEFCRKTLGSSP